MPRFFFRASGKFMSPSPSPDTTSSSSRRGLRPKLDRRNAVKHFDYDASTSSSSSSARASALDDCLHTRSLDVDKTSFRVEGAEGEIESILKNLGLSGIDDFSIPADAWEARKIRSLDSDVPPRSPLTWTDSFKEEEHEGEQKGNDKEKEENDPGEREREVVVGGGFVGAKVLTKLTPGWGGLRADDSSAKVVESRGMGHEISGGVFKGIRGIRPARLRCSPSSDEDEEEEVVIWRKPEQERGIRAGETAVLSTSCSFSTSIDDDSSSSTSTVSPNMRVRRMITSWDKGQRLGRGSFGSVYEGIAE